MRRSEFAANAYLNNTTTAFRGEIFDKRFAADMLNVALTRIARVQPAPRKAKSIFNIFRKDAS